MVIVAVGQTVDFDFLEEADIARDDRGKVLIGQESLMTSSPGIFMAGDAVTGRGTAVEAVASGKKAAAMIDSYLQDSRELNPMFVRETSDFFTLDKKMVPNFFIPINRWETVKISRQNRVRSFEEVDLGFTEKEALEEARRCLNCKQCGSCIFERSQICFEQATRILW
jgi:NADH dehydrogenase FAD-containing subunit